MRKQDLGRLSDAILVRNRFGGFYSTAGHSVSESRKPDSVLAVKGRRPLGTDNELSVYRDVICTLVCLPACTCMNDGIILVSGQTY